MLVAGNGLGEYHVSWFLFAAISELSYTRVSVVHANLSRQGYQLSDAEGCHILMIDVTDLTSIRINSLPPSFNITRLPQIGPRCRLGV